MNITTRIALVALLALPLASAMAAEPVEGKDYFLVDPALPPTDPSKIVVTEFFSYQCPHCYRFAKPFAAWIGAPAGGRQDGARGGYDRARAWVPAAQAFYALMALKTLPELDDALFGAIHDDHKLLTLLRPRSPTGSAGQGIDRTALPERVSVVQRAAGTNAARGQAIARCAAAERARNSHRRAATCVAISDDGDFNDQLALADSLIKRARTERAPANRK